MSVRVEQVQALAERHGVDAVSLAAAVNEEFERRGEERKRRREEREANRAPDPNDRYRAIREGSYKPQRRPRSSPLDREYVGGPLRHWRTVHGLTQREAQVRIGLKATSQTWHFWEMHVSCPPYRTLLQIIAATGLGHIADLSGQPRGDAVLDVLATDTRARLEVLRAERERQRADRTATVILR